MEFYILDDKNLNRIGIIDNPISYIWNNKFFTAGDFSIEVPETQKYISLFKKNRFIKRVDVENEIAIIETISNSKDENGNAKIIIAGTFAQSLLGRRVVWNKTLLNGNFISEIRRIINENAIDPEIENRKLASLKEIVSKTGNEIINNNYGNPNLISISGNYKIEQSKINEPKMSYSDSTIFPEKNAIIKFSDDISFQIDDSFVWAVGSLIKNPNTNAIDTIEQSGNIFVKKQRNLYIKDFKIWLEDYLSSTFEIYKNIVIEQETIDYEYFKIFKIPITGILKSEPFCDSMISFAQKPTNKQIGIWCEQDFLCIKLHGRNPTWIKNFDFQKIRLKVYNENKVMYNGQGFFNTKNYPEVKFTSLDEKEESLFWFELYNFVGYTVDYWFPDLKQYEGITDVLQMQPTPGLFFAKGSVIAELQTKEIPINVEIKTISNYSNATKFGLYQNTELANATMFLSFEKGIAGSSFLKLEENPLETTQTIYEILNGENLQEYVEKLLQKNNLGLQFLLNENEKTIYVHFHLGLNRTENQKENKQIIFSKNLDNLISYEINESTQGKYNVARCYGKDNNDSEIWTQAGAGAGLSRREVFKDVSEMSDVGTADYTQALVNSGELELNGFTIAIGTEIELNNYKYRQHFNLGDIITIKINDLNLSYNIRIIEVCETFDSNGYKISLILGE